MFMRDCIVVARSVAAKQSRDFFGSSGLLPPRVARRRKDDFLRLRIPEHARNQEAIRVIDLL
jgi:hypothetical protein